MKRTCIFIIIICMLLLSACGTATVSYEAPELLEPVQAQPKTAVVQREDLLNATALTGNIALYTEPVAFVIDGTLDTLNVFPGQTVQKGDILAALDTESLQEQLDTLLEQKENTGYINALTNRNLQIDVDICQLKLDELVSAQEAATALQTEAITALQTALEQLQQSSTSAIAALEQQITALQGQLESPDLLPAEADALRAEITAAEEQIGQLTNQSSSTAESTAAQLKSLQAELDTLKAQQELERKLYELDLEDAQLTLKHAKQTQAQAAKQVNTQIEQLQEKISKATIAAPMDGVVTWISDAKKVTAEKAFIYIADPEQCFVRTEEFSDNKLKNAEQIYAVIGSEKYDLTYRPLSVDERIYMTLNDIAIYTLYDFDSGAQVPESMNALVFCVHSSRENVLSIPSNALHTDSLGSYVYRMEDGQKQQVYIKTGISTGLRVEVVSGLEEGDVVYVAD